VAAETVMLKPLREQDGQRAEQRRVALADLSSTLSSQLYGIEDN